MAHGQLFGDTISIDNSNPFAALTEFQKSILDPLERQLKGQKKELVQRYLCAWNETLADGTLEQRSKYLTSHEIDEHPMKYLPVDDGHGNKITKAEWEEVQDTTAVRLVNDKGSNYIIHELGKFFNDKVILGDISRDEAVDAAADTIDRTFAYIIFNEYEYGVSDATQLITSASNLQESFYIFLTSVCGGKTRDALIAILTGGGIQVHKDESQQPQNFGERISGGGKR